MILGYLWLKTEKTANRRFKLLVKTVLTAVVALAINQVIGFIYFRPRPFVFHQVNLLVGRSTDASFPSDHTTFAAAFTGALFKEGRLLAVIMAIFTVILGISRVYAGAHYPLDVLGGIFTGIMGNYLVSLFWPGINCLVDQIAGKQYN